VLAFVLALAGSGGALAWTLSKKYVRALLLAVAVLLFLAAASPARFGWTRTVPWGLAALAAASAPASLAPRTRGVLLALAAVLAVGGVAAAVRLGPFPKSLAPLAWAGALASAAWIVASRVRPAAPGPKGPTVAVFGGSFDPFHRAHRALAEAALKTADRLLLVVAARPPHKGAAPSSGRAPTPFHHRVAMARLGIEGMPRTEVSEIEGRREGPSYPVDTLEALRRLYPPGTRFRLVLGADSFHDFPLWHDWEGILDRADLLVAARPGFDLEPPPEFEGRNSPVEALPVPALDVSSTTLRERVRTSAPTGEDLSPAVAAYVRDHGLYRDAAVPPDGDAESSASASGGPPSATEDAL
jgi:nicotinate-nucleotide adenylyltransferase